MRSILGTIARLASKLGVTVLGARALFVCAVLLLAMSINLYRDYPNIKEVFATSDVIFLITLAMLVILTGWLSFSRNAAAILREDAERQEKPSGASRIFKVLFASGAMAGVLLIIFSVLLIVIERTDLITERSIEWTFLVFSALCFPFMDKYLK